VKRVVPALLWIAGGALLLVSLGAAFAGAWRWAGVVAVLGAVHAVGSLLLRSRAHVCGWAAVLAYPVGIWAERAQALAARWYALASSGMFPPPGGPGVLALVLALPAVALAGVLLFLASRYPAPRRRDCSVVLCRTQVGFPVVVGESDRYLHTVVVGPTGCGKSSREVLPMVCQDIDRIARGERLGVTVVEPKGDLVRQVEEYARSRGVPVVLVDPEDPGTPRFNPLQGDPLIVAEVTRTVLKSMFGRQEAFFSHVQETSAHNTVLLLKILNERDRALAVSEGREPPVLTMQDLVRVLRNPDRLKAAVEALRKVAPDSDLVEYFDREALGPTGQKLHEFAMGLRMQLEDIAGSPQLRHVFGGPSDVDLDAHLRGGGVLCVNSCMGLLGRKGDLFGQFFVMHFQQAVFRRPAGDRAPHFLYLDEFPRYLNPDFERMVAMARSYRCGLTLAIQVTDQLLLAEAPAFREVLMQNCRNRVVFGGLSASDAMRFSKEFGEARKRTKQTTFRRQGMVLMPWWPDSFREQERPETLFEYTRLIHLSKWHVVYQVVRDGVVQVPREGVSLPWPRFRRVQAVASGGGRSAVPAGPGAPEAEAVAVPAAPAVSVPADDDFF